MKIEEPKAASQKEGSKTACGVCGRAISECRACWEAGGDAEDAECNRLGYERQRAEIEKLNAELARMDLALGATKRLVRRLADSEGAAVASSISANTDALSEKQRADAAEAEVLRLTKERDELRKSNQRLLGYPCDPKTGEPSTGQQVESPCVVIGKLQDSKTGMIWPADAVSAIQAERARLTKDVQEAREELEVAWADCHDGTCRACAKCCDASEASAKALREALDDLVAIIKAAGLLNLSRRVQLGPAVWYVKASDAMEAAGRALAPPNPSAEKPTSGPRE